MRVATSVDPPATLVAPIDDSGIDVNALETPDGATEEAPMDVKTLEMADGLAE